MAHSVSTSQERLARLKASLLSDEDCIPGWDDHGSSVAGSTGRTYDSLEELWLVQSEERDSYYASNSLFWDRGGYGGADDFEAMIGDAVLKLLLVQHHVDHHRFESNGRDEPDPGPLNQAG